MTTTKISSPFRRFNATLGSLALAVGLMLPPSAWAELSNDTIVGPGIRLRPAYDGSDTQRAELVPVVRYLGEPWFVRSTQGVLEGGARIALAPGLHLGAQLAYEPGRRTSESDFLTNRSVFELNRGASVGAHLEWDYKIGPMPITLLARVRQHTQSDRGAQADLRFSAGVFQSHSGRLGLGVFAQGTWADAKATRALYAVTPEQSVASGLPVYGAGSGWLYGSAGLLWSFDLTRTWVAVGNFEVRHLSGDARRSPLVEDSTNYYMSAGVAYRF